MAGSSAKPFSRRFQPSAARFPGLRNVADLGGNTARGPSRSVNSFWTVDICSPQNSVGSLIEAQSPSTLQIPADPSLAGLSFYTQGVLLDLSAGTALMTNAAEGLIGAR